MSPLIESRRVFSIGMASRLSGVPIETIRTWERRYDFLQPVRTSGGHRKFTQDDVATLKKLRALTARGHRIGDLTREALAEIDVEEPVRASANASASDTRPGDESFIASIVNAARALDADQVDRELVKPWQSGDTRYATTKMLDVLRAVGDLWHEGALEVSAEHLVERAVTKRLFAALSLLPRPRGLREAVVAGPPGELHEVGILTAALMLHEAGVAATYLGGNLPVSDLQRAIETRKPAFVVLGVTTPLAPDDLAALARVLRPAVKSGARVLIGGASAAPLAREVAGADLLPSIDALTRVL